MKCWLLLLALAVVLGVSSGMSLRSKLRGGPLARRLAEKMAKRTQAGGEFSGVETLAGKCELAKFIVKLIADSAQLSFENTWEMAMQNLTIYHACPYVKKYVECFESAEDGAVRDEMKEKLAPYGQLFACSNLYADLELFEIMIALEWVEPEESHYWGILMQYDLNLINQCPTVFENAEEDANQLIQDLDDVEGAECTADKRSAHLRTLLTSLKQLLAASDVNKRR